MRIQIKPLSANILWRGRKFKTPEYQAYEQEFLYKLLRTEAPVFEQYILKATFGFSNKSADLSNPLKAFEDILQKKYGFNDNKIYEIHLKKDIVAKGSEYIDFELLEYKEKIKLVEP